MPMLRIFTNVDVPRPVGSDLLKELSAKFTELVRKPEKYVNVHIMPNQIMSFSGDEKACAYCEVMSIGNIGGDVNVEISAAVAKVLKEKLGVDGDRYYILFVDAARPDVGFNSTTFGAM